MKWEVLADGAELADGAAARLLAAVDANSRIVLGLPTGNTPLELYRRVVAACRLSRHCFAGATTFNLDEYVGLPGDHPGSYRAYMERHFLGHVDLDPRRAHVPDGTASLVLREHPDLSIDQALARECRRYEDEIRAAGGLDLTFLGLGVNGHIAFNEPGSPFASRTRVVELAPSTRRANAQHFAGGEDVPRRAITMGIGTILESRAIVLLASGEAKAAAVTRLRAGDVGEDFPASALHRHPDVTVLVDRAAAERIGRGRTTDGTAPRRRGPGGTPFAPLAR